MYYYFFSFCCCFFLFLKYIYIYIYNPIFYLVHVTGVYPCCHDGEGGIGDGVCVSCCVYATILDIQFMNMMFGCVYFFGKAQIILNHNNFMKTVLEQINSRF